MKAKLIKTGSEYLLRDLSGEVLGITIGEINGKLSLKNCQAIERGYDLDELAEKHINHEPHTTYILQRKFDFIDGFRKALQILGDRRFTEEDLLKTWNKGAFYGSTELGNTYYFNGHIQSLQQNEWEVEVEMICPHPSDTYRCGIQYGCDEDGCNHPNQVPYLDADGCLILKRVV